MPDRPTSFGHVVGQGLQFAQDSQGAPHTLLNVLVVATLFNLILRCDSKEPSGVASTVKENGVAWAGIPENSVVDNSVVSVLRFFTVTSDTGILHRVIPVVAPWQHCMVESHGQVLPVVIQAMLYETKVSGKEQMTVVLRMTSLAKNRRPGTSGYSPRALRYGIDERIMVSGLDHYLEQPNGAALTRDDTAHARSMEHRMLAMKAVIKIDHLERWQEAIRYPCSTGGSNLRRTRRIRVLLGKRLTRSSKGSEKSLKGSTSRPALQEKWKGGTALRW